jgi:hypothetical protein
MQKYGIMIMSGFAAVWCVWGLSALGSVPVVLLLLPLAVSGALAGMAARIRVVADDATKKRVGRVVGIASGIEGVAILAAVNGLTWTGHAGYAVCATAAIVGAAMTLLAVAACAIPADATRLFVVGSGMALLLWVTCLAAFGSRPVLAPTVA